MTKPFRWLVAWVTLVSACFGADSGKRPITHEDLWLMKRVGAPKPSPDGKWAVVSVTEPAYDAKDQSVDLWLIAVDGAQPSRKLTHTKASESGPEWSPDGTKIAFSAKREGDDLAQIYVLDVMRGGEAERVTTLATGAKTPRWSPNGKQLLFVSEVYLGATDEDANRKAAKAVKDRKHTARVYEGFPIKYWDRWLDEKRAHLFVQDATPGAKARDLFAKTKFAAQPGFGGRQTDSGEDVPAAWAPDGNTIVFVAATGRHRSAYASVPTQLFEVAVDGGEPRPLTSDQDSYGEPEFLPDGRGLLVEVTKGGDGKTYHHTRIAAFPWPFDAKQRRVLTESFGLSAVSFAPTSDSRTVYFTAEAGHQVKLFSVPFAGGQVKAHELAATGGFPSFAIGGDTLLANFDSALTPPEVARLDPAKGTMQVLTRFNADRLARLDLAPVEHFAFQAKNGREIHSLMVRPPNFDPAKKYPLFVMIHGGPTPQFKDQWVLRWNYHLFAAPGYVVLLTNYSGSTGYSEEFGQAVQLDPLRGPANEINEAADEAIRRYPFIDSSRQAAGGASYGGHLANWLQATTTRYKCLIAHAGLVNLETQWATSDVIYHRELNNGGPVWEQGPIWREQNPVRLIGNHATKTGWVTPTLLTVGELDYRVPANNTYEAWAYLQRLQIPSKLLVFPDENHWILKGENSRFWYGEVHAWLARWLGTPRT
jgi:dipeptidyl aminopeptidase/acylaminoacyl peptidase